MAFTFTANIYKVGINLCVDVPPEVTKHMEARKGYIPITGTINGFPFDQTLVPVKNKPCRLFVNGLMLKGTGARLGDAVYFDIEQDHRPRTAASLPMPPMFKKRLDEEHLAQAFARLTDYRQKEVLRYLNNLKTEEALVRNIDKVIHQLKKKT